MKRAIRRNKKKIILVVLALVVFIIAVAILFRIYNHRVEKTLAAVSYTDEAEDTAASVDGIAYERDSSIKSYLFLGVDDAGLDYSTFGGGGRTDTIMLLVKNGEEIRILEISRDTMTEVDIYDAKGRYMSSGVMQINMQYAYGDSPRRSAYLTKQTVSELLGGINISGAIALNMSGIAPIVDAMGGVDVRMEEDCSYINPDYTLGAEVHMDGAQAERFIRWRDTSESGSNEGRMSRHTWFVRQMLQQADEDTVSTLLEVADPYLNTDLTVDELMSLYECHLVETFRLPGESREGDLHDEFYVDEEALRELELKLFYTPTASK